jgi:hypothetical protein
MELVWIIGAGSIYPSPHRRSRKGDWVILTHFLRNPEPSGYSDPVSSPLARNGSFGNRLGCTQWKNSPEAEFHKLTNSMLRMELVAEPKGAKLLGTFFAATISELRRCPP